MCVCVGGLFTLLLPLEAALADKRSEGDSSIHPSSPPGLDWPLRAGQAVYGSASGLRPVGVAPWKSIKADERENELEGRAAGLTRAAWGIEMRIEMRWVVGSPTLKTN